MNAVTVGLIAGVASYGAGSLPFGYLTARLAAHVDIRQAGSGNIGATNIGRVLGAKWGLLVLCLDCLKGFLPVLLLPRLLLDPEDAEYLHVQVVCGTATILGHMFPCWLGFRGGKGVATALGVVLVLGGWQAMLAALTAFAVGFLVFRIVSVGSILAAVVFAASQMWLLTPAPFSSSRWSLAAFSLLVPLLIIVRHRANLVRIFRGEEERFRFGSRPGG